MAVIRLAFQEMVTTLFSNAAAYTGEVSHLRRVTPTCFMDALLLGAVSKAIYRGGLLRNGRSAFAIASGVPGLKEVRSEGDCSTEQPL